MKSRFIIFIVSLVILFSSVYSIAGVPVNNTPKIKVEGLVELTHQEFLDLNAKEVKQKTGKRIGLKKKIALKIAQNKLKNGIKKGNAPTKTQEFKFNIGGFLLGFFFGLIGTLLCLLFKDQKNAVLSSLIGLGVLILIVVLLI